MAVSFPEKNRKLVDQMIRHYPQQKAAIGAVLSRAQHQPAQRKARRGIGAGETTGDGKYTLWTVECLGACDLAPSLMINDKLHGPMTPEKLDSLLDSLEE